MKQHPLHYRILKCLALWLLVFAIQQMMEFETWGGVWVAWIDEVNSALGKENSNPSGDINEAVADGLGSSTESGSENSSISSSGLREGFSQTESTTGSEYSSPESYNVDWKWPGYDI